MIVRSIVLLAEPFSDWLEDKIDVPIFEELPAPECGQNKPIVYPIITKNHHEQQERDETRTLLEEFETVLEDVEACHQIIPSSISTLTPPQSPPPNKSLAIDTQLLVTLQPVVQTIQPIISSQQPVYNIIVPQEKQQDVYQTEVCIPEEWNTENVSLDPLGGDVANDLAVVDEYVRSHTEDVPPPYSPCTSPSGSCASSDQDSTDDPDWIAETSSSSSRKQQSSYVSNKNRHHKPYSRPSVEDKKVRKKEQNKNAATRYRQKKKQEIKDILGEERELTEHNEKLQCQVKDLQREIGYLKGLMRDLFKAKGLIK